MSDEVIIDTRVLLPNRSHVLSPSIFKLSCDVRCKTTAADQESTKFLDSYCKEQAVRLQFIENIHILPRKLVSNIDSDDFLVE